MLKKIKQLKKEIGTLVEKRKQEFMRNKNYFSELCFCILTANFSAEKGIYIQNKMGRKFAYLPEKELAQHLKALGHRFPNARAKYIVEARKHINTLPAVLKTYKGERLREWFVKNIKGIGYKEASHFLRNVGFFDYAILDYHILDLLDKKCIVKRPKNISKSKYLEIEGVLKSIAHKVGLEVGILDLYLWYMETGKVLK